MILRMFGLTVVMACASLTSAVADVAWQDAAFDDSDWSLSVFFSEGNKGEAHAAQVAGGGDPGAFRSVSITVNNAPPYTGVWAFHRYTPALYDPAVSGAITSIDYGESAILLQGGGQGQATGPAVKQSGVVYYHWIGGTAYASWTDLGASSLTAEDFVDTPYTYNHPDFSAGAPPLEVGFYRANSTYSGGYTTVSGIDNWSFTIRTEPSLVESSSWGEVKSLFR